MAPSGGVRWIAIAAVLLTGCATPLEDAGEALVDGAYAVLPDYVELGYIPGAELTSSQWAAGASIDREPVFTGTIGWNLFTPKLEVLGPRLDLINEALALLGGMVERLVVLEEAQAAREAAAALEAARRAGIAAAREEAAQGAIGAGLSPRDQWKQDVEDVLWMVGKVAAAIAGVVLLFVGGKTIKRRRAVNGAGGEDSAG